VGWPSGEALVRKTS